MPMTAADAEEWVSSVPAAGEAFCCSWSGGKDSCLALQRAASNGGIPRTLVTVFAEGGLRTRSHGLHRSVVEAQASALGLELRTVSASWDDYREKLVGVLSEARCGGVEAAVFGDIDIVAHRDWELSVASEAGLRGHLPLWGLSRWDVLEAWWSLGFVARIVVVRESALPRAFLGRTLDAPAAREIEALGADPCGENGEFHSLAVDGPLFRQPLQIEPGTAVRRADCWVEDLRVRTPVIRAPDRDATRARAIG